MAGPELTEEQKQQQFEAACKAKPLKDQLPSLRAIEGFPIGKDEDILALSDTPYYTACPNPYINDFIAAFGKPYDPATDDYERTPFVGDISEGKNDPVYLAHPYHTKVPPKAIMKFIEHYSNEGDIVFDGFCGTGMAGIAANNLNRKAILIDLSPIATFISSNYSHSTNPKVFQKESKQIIDDVKNECGWMYETLHTDKKTKGVINYTVWSDVLICPFCENEYVFFNAAMDSDQKNLLKEYDCPACHAKIDKDSSKRAVLSVFDSTIQKSFNQNKQVPVLISYSIGKKRFEKEPDDYDLNIIEKINRSSIPYEFPFVKMMFKDGNWGDIWRSGYHNGITHAHHFYTKRNLWIYAALWQKAKDRNVKWALSAIQNYINKKQSYTGGGGGMPGVLYIASLVQEKNVLDVFNRKCKRLIENNILSLKKRNVITSTQSATNLKNLNSNSIDYIFVDPPFGANIMYSEGSFLWESWLRLYTNNKSEAIMNKTQSKELNQYKELMTNSFKEFYRILKPNRWITIEFHNSKASVWNAIQDSITKAGFVVAQVSILDKKQGSFKQVTSPGSVDNDPIINAYKPRHAFEERFLKRAGADLEKDFVAEHLSHLPKEPNIERTEQMLFSKMLAHYIQHGYEIRLNARQFYNLLRDHFKFIDSYWFLDNEIAQYEEWKKANGLQAIEAIAKGQQTLFVTDERSFLIWLYNYLATPKTFGEIFTASRNILSSSSKIEDQIPEPKQLLETNFIFQDGKYRRPTTESEREGIESRREKELQKAFEKILEQAQTGAKKIKDVRKESIAYGFTIAYQEKRFTDIITVAKKLDKEILENNSEINDFVEIAQLKVGEGI